MNTSTTTVRELRRLDVRGDPISVNLVFKAGHVSRSTGLSFRHRIGVFSFTPGKGVFTDLGPDMAKGFSYAA